MSIAQSDDELLQLQGPSRKAMCWLAAIVAVLPTAVTWIALRAAPHPAGHLAAVVLAAVAGSSLVVFLLLSLVASRRMLVLTSNGIDLRSSFYRLQLSKADVVVEGIRPVDSACDEAVRVAWRTNGIAFPGFQSGWFRSRTGGKLFVARAGADCVVVPSQLGFQLLLGSPQSAELAELLRRHLSQPSSS